MIREVTFATVASLIQRLPDQPVLSQSDLLIPQLCMAIDSRIAVYYAPFDHTNPSARVALLGITPGWTEMEVAYRQARDDLRIGLSSAEIGSRIKQRASFAGSMRRNLVAMLDALDLPKRLRIPSSASLFGSHHALLHTTSVLRYPVFTCGRNYTGHSPALLQTPLLRGMVEQLLAPELEGVRQAVLIPLGKAASDALRYLVARRAVEERRCLFGFPHPSGANGSRVRQFHEHRDELRTTLHDLLS